MGACQECVKKKWAGEASLAPSGCATMIDLGGGKKKKIRRNGCRPRALCDWRQHPMESPGRNLFKIIWVTYCVESDNQIWWAIPTLYAEFWVLVTDLIEQEKVTITEAP